MILDPGMIKVNTKAMEEASKHLGLKSLKGVEKHGALLEFFAQSAVAKLKAVRYEFHRYFLCGVT